MAKSFDVDSYLAEDDKKGFNPDEYLNDFNIDSYLQDDFKKREPSKYENLMAALQGFGERATFGALPKMQAGLESVLPSPTKESDIALQQKGFKLPEEKKYPELVKEYVGREEQLRGASPKSFTAGQIGGSLASAIPITSGLGAVPGLARAGAITRGTIAGGIEGLAETPKEILSPEEEIQARKKSLLTGAAFGAGGEVAGKVIGRGLKTVKELPEGLKKFSDQLALKQSGAMLRDLRSIHTDVKHKELAKGVKSILSLGDSVDDIAKKSMEIKQGAGQTIGSIYDNANDKAYQMVLNNELNPAQIQKLEDSDFYIKKMAKEIKSNIKEKFQGKPGGNDAIRRVDRELKNLAQRGEVANLQDIQDFKVGINQIINYEKAVKDMPVQQRALREMSNELRNRVEKRVSALDDVLGKEDLKSLKEANKRYEVFSTINDMASDKSKRDQANMYFGLTDRLIGMGSMGIGAGIGAYSAESPEARVGLGLAGLAVGRAARRYGPGVMSRGADVLGTLTKPVGALGGAGQAIAAPILDRPGLIGALSSQAAPRSKKKRLQALEDEQQ